MKVVGNNPTGTTVVLMVIAALVVRAGIEIAADAVFPQASYWIGKAAQILFYALLIGLSWGVIQQAHLEAATLFGRMRPRQAIDGMAWAVVLLGFSLGSGFLYTFAFAHVDLDLAYSSGHYHSVPIDTLGNTVSGIVIFAIPQFILAPFTEELVFRGLLLRLLTKKHGPAVAVLMSSLLFALFHFSQSDYVGTFVFGVIVAMLYLRTGSLWVPVITHSAYNLFAYLQQGLFDFHWTRTKYQILDLWAWKPEILLLCISTLVIAAYLWACRKAFRVTAALERP